jgi:hypothetical protein
MFCLVLIYAVCDLIFRYNRGVNDKTLHRKPQAVVVKRLEPDGAHVDEFIIAVFCCVDDLLKRVTQGQKIRAHGFAPKVSDSEVLTMEMIGEYLKIDTDEPIWQYFRRHWQNWFPTLGRRSSFVRQAAALWQYQQRMPQQLAAALGAFDDPVQLIDGLPMPVCRFGRAHCCRSFQGAAD